MFEKCRIEMFDFQLIKQIIETSPVISIVHNLKQLLRAKFGRKGSLDIKDLTQPVGHLSGYMLI